MTGEDLATPLDTPDAAGLIAIALKTFRETVLPAVPAEQRFAALMIANALSIAERELTVREDPALADALRRLTGAEGDVPNLSRRLCTAITEGAFDGRLGSADELRDTLWALTWARLAVSNPKHLNSVPPRG
ncbi:DUF6285 domain-containing protein [Azospirillum sp. SYSU D00513]|uniref:DUF6285 domain-containing protein n=1 Tax=Azospirillum sp. SYSU D00513 TaxID=2812561 RepID=UPI001A977FFD|nr:DUF6285 domain-containing protein [Azospirillum sp. SYSU D00513]